MTHRVRSLVLRCLIALPAMIAIACGGGCSLESRFYKPGNTDFPTPDGVEDVSINVSDHEHLHGWFVPPPSGDSDAPLIIFCHGSATTIDRLFDTLQSIAAEADAALLMFSYRGYGRSSPRANVTRASTVEDTRCVVNAAMQRPDIDHDRIVLFGYSLGAVPALKVASEDTRIAGAISGGTYSRADAALDDIGKGWIAPFIGGYADPVESAARLGSRPLFLFHGEIDDAVRVHHAYAIAAASSRADVPTTLRIIPNAGHYNVLDVEPEVTRALAAFVRDIPSIKERP